MSYNSWSLSALRFGLAMAKDFRPGSAPSEQAIMKAANWLYEHPEGTYEEYWNELQKRAA